MNMSVKTSSRLYGFLAFFSFLVLFSVIGQFLIGVWVNTRLSEWSETLNRRPDVEAHWQSESSGLFSRSGKLNVSFSSYNFV